MLAPEAIRQVQTREVVHDGIRAAMVHERRSKVPTRDRMQQTKWLGGEGGSEWRETSGAGALIRRV